MKIKIHKFYVWPEVMGSRPGQVLLEWCRILCVQQQDEIIKEKVIQWRKNQKLDKEQNGFQSIFDVEDL